MGIAGYNNAGSNNSWVYYGLNSINQCWQSIIMPEEGDITSLSAYFGGANGSVNARLCLWDAGGNLLRQSGQFSQPGGSYAINGQSWATQGITSYHASKNQQLFVGFWRDAAGGHILSYNSNGGGSFAYKATGGGPTNTAGYSSSSGKFAAYLTYTPSTSGGGDGGGGTPPPQGGVKVWQAGNGWQKHPVKVWQGGNGWQWHPVREWNGSSWVRRA